MVSRDWQLGVLCGRAAAGSVANTSQEGDWHGRVGAICKPRVREAAARMEGQSRRRSEEAVPKQSRARPGPPSNVLSGGCHAATVSEQKLQGLGMSLW